MSGATYPAEPPPLGGATRTDARLTAITACHNRRDRTIECLASLFAQEVPGVRIDAVVVDDGSTDGTFEAVSSRFPLVTMIRGDGSLYWAGGMAVAEKAALATSPDFLLWLNDDVVLDPGAVATLFTALDQEGIVVGALRDPRSGELTYSGVRRTGLHPLRMERIQPGEEPIPVETFNGNVVLVPAAIARRVGPLDAGFVHAAADFDYGLRAAGLGITTVLAPGTVGVCAPNPSLTPWTDPSLSVAERLRLLVGPKGAPPRARARYLRRHGGPFWPLFWATPYIRGLPSVLRPTRRDAAQR